MAQAFNEPHSIKQREDGVRWAVGDTDPQTITATQIAFYRALVADLGTRTAPPPSSPPSSNRFAPFSAPKRPDFGR
jgi:hypothetical protein